MIFKFSSYSNIVENSKSLQDLYVRPVFFEGLGSVHSNDDALHRFILLDSSMSSLQELRSFLGASLNSTRRDLRNSKELFNRRDLLSNKELIQSILQKPTSEGDSEKSFKELSEKAIVMLGQCCGAAEYERASASLAAFDSLSKLGMLPFLFSFCGLGILQLSDTYMTFVPGHSDPANPLTVFLENSCCCVHGVAGETACSLIEGYLTGFISTAFDLPENAILCFEISCACNNLDRCTFEITWVVS